MQKSMIIIGAGIAGQSYSCDRGTCQPRREYDQEDGSREYQSSDAGTARSSRAQQDRRVWPKNE